MQRRPVQLAWVNHHFELTGRLETLRQVANINDVLALIVPNQVQGLQGAARTTHVQDIQGEFNAIDTALSRLSAGDLCLILIDQVEEALAYITEKVKASTA